MLGEADGRGREMGRGEVKEGEGVVRGEKEVKGG